MTAGVNVRGGPLFQDSEGTITSAEINDISVKLSY